DDLVHYVQPVLTFIGPPLLAAFLGGYLVTRWKGRVDYTEKRLDELSELVLKVAELSSDYWCTDYTSSSAKLLFEARIRAGLARIAGLRALLESGLSRSGCAELQSAESDFLRETTGGDFGVHNRASDLSRMIACQFTAAAFVVNIRRARMK